MADETNYRADVARYATSVDDAAIAGIVKHLGIALRSRDSSLVSCTDAAERDRIRDGFLRKKLALTGDDAALDGAIVEVCGTMKDDPEKARVTFYYLLAQKFDKLSSFR